MVSEACVCILKEQTLYITKNVIDLIINVITSSENDNSVYSIIQSCYTDIQNLILLKFPFKIFFNIFY